MDTTEQTDIHQWGKRALGVTLSAAKRLEERWARGCSALPAQVLLLVKAGLTLNDLALAAGCDVTQAHVKTLLSLLETSRGQPSSAGMVRLQAIAHQLAHDGLWGHGQGAPAMPWAKTAKGHGTPEHSARPQRMAAQPV